MAAPSRTPTIQKNGGRLRPADNFERACFAAVMAATGSGGVPKDPVAAAKALFPNDDVSFRLLVPPAQRTGPEWVQRAAVSGATTTDPAWAGALIQQAAGDFVASLAPISAFAKVLNAGTRIVLDGGEEATISIPRRTTGPASDVPWIGEGVPIPARRFALSAVTVGPLRKLAVFSALSREIVRRSAAMEIVTDALRADCATSLDASVFSTAAATAARPAGILANIAPLTPAAGADVSADLSALARAVADGGGSGRLAIVCNPRQAARLLIWAQPAQAGTGFEIYPTVGVPAGTVVALDPTAIVGAFGPDVDIAASIHAAVVMDDNPTHVGVAGSPNVVAATTSTFQVSSVAVRAILDATYAMTAPAAAFLTGVAW